LGESEVMINNTSSSPQVEMAKIGAKQAIVVALITAVAAIIGTVLSQSVWRKAPPPQAQWYLAIDDVTILARSSTNEMSPPLRIIPIANGQAYSYPSRALWVAADSSISGEEFPLPLFSDRVAVRFDAFVRRGNSIGQLTSQELQSYSIQQLPVKGTYELDGIDDSFTRGLANTTKVRIAYEIKTQ
jgi:hypothetical protein